MKFEGFIDKQEAFKDTFRSTERELDPSKSLIIGPSISEIRQKDNGAKSPLEIPVVVLGTPCPPGWRPEKP